MIDSFEELRVWQSAHRLTLEIYKTTSQLPDSERFGLISQLRRAAVSVENNIAECFGRRTTKDYVGFLYGSFGSLQKVRCMLRFCRDLGYITSKQYSIMNGLAMDVVRLLNKMVSVLTHKIALGTSH